MKKNVKKLASSALAGLLAFSLSFSAFAADISAEKAKSLALKNAGYSKSQVSLLSAEADYENGVKYYEVSFIVSSDDGSYLEYDYDIRVSDGKIVKKEVEKEKGKASSSSSKKSSASAGKSSSSAKKASSSPAAESKDIGVAQAKKAALAHFSVKAEDVKFLEARKDYDDGRQVYDIEFCKPYSVKYSCEVSASDGAVRDAEKEQVREIGDKIELFIKVLISSIFKK